MYSRKSVGPRIKPWRTQAFTGYSWEELPSRTTWSHLLLRKEEIRTNIWPEIPLNLWRRPACQTLSKVLNISGATARVATDLLKSLAILSDTTISLTTIVKSSYIDTRIYLFFQKKTNLKFF